MGKIEIISASAGSGKTQELASKLYQALKAGEARPEAILATTFTNKAAAELEERVRLWLVNQGMAEEGVNEEIADKAAKQGMAEKARRLRAARIGTVNSVCGQLVKEFWYLLDLSPDVRVIDEPEAQAAVDRAISEVATAEDLDKLTELSERMRQLDGGGWQSTVREIIDLARQNNIGPEALRQDCMDKSIRGLLECIGDEPEANQESLHAELLECIERFRQHVLQVGDKTQATQDYLERCDRVKHRLEAGRLPEWTEWAGLEQPQTGRLSREAAEIVARVAARHLRHPRFLEDLKTAVTLMFELAARALEAYQRQKREWGVIDFRDQEAMALELLGKEEVRRELREQLDLFMVDEFQDTSPIQLCVFLRLAELAKKSVWIGDQKQAIYRFRGTDPALMDAVIERQRSEGEQVSSLDISHRSRAKLVHLTSELFARAFAPHGISGDMVRLSPKDPCDDEQLGPAVEYWQLRVGGKASEPLCTAVAEGVRQLLHDDPKTKVRDPITGAPRPATPGDIAVLCRTNDDCARIADCLQKIGIPAATAGANLTSTPEVQACLAALALFVDPYDAVAAAQLARLSQYPDDGNAWLEKLLEAEGAAAFDCLDAVRSVRAASKRFYQRQQREEAGSVPETEPKEVDSSGADVETAGGGRSGDNGPRELPTLAGAARALDLAIEAAGVRELCLRWGDSDLRLGNVERLRARAARYEHACATEGMPITPAGLLEYLRGAEAFFDERPSEVPPLAAAVTVSTFHSAKGLEWPIVVLAFVSNLRAESVFGVHIESAAREFCLEDPLKGRWIRYWPDPYSAQRTRAHLYTRAAETRYGIEEAKAAKRENLRLAYMVWTRARDKLVLAARVTSSGEHKLLEPTQSLTAHVRDQEEALVTVRGQLSEEQGGCVAANWGGVDVEVMVRILGEAETRQPDSERLEWYVAPGPKEHAPAVIAASSMSGTGSAQQPFAIGERTPVLKKVEDEVLGNAVHTFLAADDPEWALEQREELAKNVLVGWGLSTVLRPEQLLRISDALSEWVREAWPDGKIYREWPVAYRDGAGSVVMGAADFVVETDEGFVIVDYKTFQGGVEKAGIRAAEYFGQLNAYAEAIGKATRKPVLGMYVYYTMSGLVVPVSAAVS